MSSHRPYRPALGIEKALEEITQNKGILYDPEVVDICLKLFKEKDLNLNKRRRKSYGKERPTFRKRTKIRGRL